jgi:hypothetical protein
VFLAIKSCRVRKGIVPGTRDPDSPRSTPV